MVQLVLGVVTLTKNQLSVTLLFSRSNAVSYHGYARNQCAPLLYCFSLTPSVQNRQVRCQVNNEWRQQMAKIWANQGRFIYGLHWVSGKIPGGLLTALLAKCRLESASEMPWASHNFCMNWSSLEPPSLSKLRAVLLVMSRAMSRQTEMMP